MSSTTVHDILIMGAGPCGLAVAARLCEHRPAALFTDDEHQRFHWIRKHGSKVSARNLKTGKVQDVRNDCQVRPLSTLVLDATGGSWMERWNTLFKTFDIRHLRSPMFFHVDPADRDSLLTHVHERGTKDDLVELSGCVGKEVSKHQRKKRINGKRPANEVNINEREKEDYYTPSQRVFDDHCRCIVDKYKLKDGLVQQASVKDIAYGDFPETGQDERVFKVTTDNGVRYASTVVLAIGPANAPCIPASPTAKSHQQGSDEVGQIHSMKIREFPDPMVVQRMQAGHVTNVVVIGGGLTSAQLSDLAIRRGVTKVWHLMRGSCKVKHFDVDLSWMGKWRNVQQAAFWLADTDEERLELIKKARNGGSITPQYHKILRQHIEKGGVSLHTDTLIRSKIYDQHTSQWTIETEPPIADLPKIDYIYYATGVQTDFTTLPFLQTLMKEYPVHGHGGLPCLTNDLTWREDVPMYVTGRLASLRLGPAGGNLGGARIGAERIAWSILDRFDSKSVPDTAGFDTDGDGGDSDDEARLDFGSARFNRYQRLTVE